MGDSFQTDLPGFLLKPVYPGLAWPDQEKDSEEPDYKVWSRRESLSVTGTHKKTGLEIQDSSQLKSLRETGSQGHLFWVRYEIRQFTESGQQVEGSVTKKDIQVEASF